MATTQQPAARQRWAFCTHCKHYAPIVKPPDASALRKAKRDKKLVDERRAEFLEQVALLSDRERAVMMAIARGERPADMSHRLGIDVKTVSTYRARLFAKVVMYSTNAEIAVACADAGLLECPT